jgi:phosphatidylserine/phosphatidylglycerophosphate/cardiolipin synthase-like enzyme
MIYLMGYGGILDTLSAKAKAGVTVRVILDGVSERSANQKYYDLLKAAGVQVEWSDTQFPYMHAKSFVVDSRDAVISTGNYSLTYSIQRERNFVAHVTDPYDVADLAALFDADWQRLTPDLSCTRLVVSPVNSRQRILETLNGAKSTLVIEQMQFADNDVRAIVAQRKVAGVDVRVLLAAPSWISENTDAANFLKGANIPVRYMTKPDVHVKAFVADGKTAYMGSENMSYTSLSKNREVGLILTDASSVKPIADTFESDWATATPFP